MESFRRGQRAVVCRSEDAGSAAPTCTAGAGNWGGWLVFVDVDRDGTFGAGDISLRATVVRAPAVVVASPLIAAEQSRVVFRPDGLARRANGALLAAQIRVCVATTQPPENARDVAISGGSRMGVRRFNAGGACAAPADV
ncbi:MAG: GspH/FimT family pseudopilin [Xanthomonadales bacterium]|nr:GspH/FimT family pseudopilin [Xanthomonadales bacterium]